MLLKRKLPLTYLFTIALFFFMCNHTSYAQENQQNTTVSKQQAKENKRKALLEKRKKILEEKKRKRAEKIAKRKAAREAKKKKKLQEQEQKKQNLAQKNKKKTTIPKTKLANNTTTKKNIDTIPFIRTGNYLTKFVKGNINLEEGEIVSNVLKVVNLERRNKRFVVDLIYPAGWTRIDDPQKIYIAKAKDTTIVPIILSPKKLINGNTEIAINAFLIDENQQQVANNYFTLKTKKKVSWNINIDNNQNIYFKNEEFSKRVNFSVKNDGNFKQDLFLNYSVPRQDLYFTDTLNNKISIPSKTFTLEPNEFKEFDFKVNIKQFDKRNQRRIPLNTFNPGIRSNKKIYSLIINSSEPTNFETRNTKKRTRLNFVKLPNEKQYNRYGYSNLPLTVELFAQNIFEDQSFLNLNLRGFKELSTTSNLVYSTQLNYSQAFFSNNVFDNMPWYIGYFDEKKSIELGQVSGNIIGIANSGVGVKGSYELKEKHRLSAFYVNSDGMFGSNGNISLGGSYEYKHKNNLFVNTSMGTSFNNITNNNSTSFNIQPRLLVARKHFISLIYSFLNRDFKLTNTNKSGNLFGATYSSSFLKRKLRTNLNFRFSDKNYSAGNFSRMFFNSRLSYQVSDNWNSFLSSNYQNTASDVIPINGIANLNQESFISNFVFSKKSDSGTYQPGIYYQYRDIPNNAFVTRGLSFRYSKFNFDKNFLASVFTRAGYTISIEESVQDPKDLFSLEISTLFRYKTWNITSRYSLGNFSAFSTQNNNVNNLILPQTFRTSFQNQYQFPNRHFVIESSLIYSFNNIFDNHTLGLFPNFYYFTDSGWRFGTSVNYTFTTSDFSSPLDNLNALSNPNVQNIGAITNNNFNINFSLRKDFGIPIPFGKKLNVTSKFVAFIDINGNGIKDKDEVPLNNVVIKLGDQEIITNVDGEATFKNLKKSNYQFDVFSLEKLVGWFPNIENLRKIDKDGIQYVPFVRGVKVYGDVIVDRQKIAVADKTPLDLSRIQITATQGEKSFNALTNSKGRFEFYLPYGNYIFTLDEKILGDRLKISRNNIPVTLKSGQDGVYVSFYIVEKRRRIIFKDFTKKKKEAKKDPKKATPKKKTSKSRRRSNRNRRRN